MQPTKRAVIEPLRACNIRCKFCYYLHDEMESIKPVEQVKNEIDCAKERGNDYIDITGGEPTCYPHLGEIVDYALTKGMKSCVITNGLNIKNMPENVDDWLISIHGVGQTHDYLVCKTGAFIDQSKFIDKVKTFRTNTVINKYNQHDILNLTDYFIDIKPRIVNFINMNPHHGWMYNQRAKDVIANLDIVEPLINEAVEKLEQNKIGINIRYFPMCRIKEKYRKYVCNDLQVVFDPYEWDYDIQPKTIEAFREWAERTSNDTELKEEPCKSCSLHKVCGGINKYFYEADNASVKPLKGKKIEDPFYYRK